MAEDTAPALNWYPVGPVDEIKSKKCRKLYTDSGENELALFSVTKDNKDKFYAASATCPHAKGPIDQGDIEDLGQSFVVTCPVHLYTFDLETGSNISGVKLPVYETDVRDEQVYVKAPEMVYLKSAAKRAKESKAAGQCGEQK